jgi:twitching motility protein PilT
MIDRINRTSHKHVVTIEDPIEMLHVDRGSLINQREVGLDTESFASALRRVLRQDPDVIMIGEIRDLVTMETALSAAETGHLVLSTMHTLDATETVNRAIGFFPLHQQQQVRAMLAGTLKGVISQRLVRTADGQGRVPACEVMITTGRARDMILNADETGRLHEVIRDGEFYGMQTFDQSLFDHVTSGRVPLPAAMDAASSPHDFKLMLDAGAARRDAGQYA